MAPSPEAAVENYRVQQRVAVSTMALARRLWARLGDGDFDQAWAALGPQLLVILQAGQSAAATQAQIYVPAVLEELNISTAALAQVNPRSVVGIASDGRDLGQLLFKTIIRTRVSLGEGMSLAEAKMTGQHLLDRIVQTQVADAGRAIESVESAVRPAVTRYVRMLVPPSCARCAVLAGRIYTSKKFYRHTLCDCRHIPCDENVAGDLTTNSDKVFAAGQVTGMTKAEAKSIAEGADPAKVINSRRGMYSEGGLKLTREGTRTPGTPRRVVRLRPEEIYKLSNNGQDTAEMLRLLRLYGYILP